MSYGLEPGVLAALVAASVAPVPAVPVPFVPVLDELLDAVNDGIETEMFTFDEPPDAFDAPPVAFERPPDATALPMPPTDDEFEFVVAEEFAEVPILFRLDPPPCPMPTDDEPDVEPELELAVVSA